MPLILMAHYLFSLCILGFAGVKILGWTVLGSVKLLCCSYFFFI
jgi:hypothetical protein